MAKLEDSFDVQVAVEDIVDLASFTVTLTYTPTIVTVEGISLGSFLDNKERTFSEKGRSIDNEAGVTSYEVSSSGTASGPDGSGTLVTVTLNAVGPGVSPLHLEHMTVTRKTKVIVPVVTQDGYVTVADAFIRIEPPGRTARIGSPFTVTVVISDVTDLGSFQFDLTYDSHVVTATGAACGPFLGSTGRSVTPVGPEIDNTAGRIAFGCSSEGSGPGPDGTGILATVIFNAVDLGTSPLQFENVLVTDTDSSAIAALAQDGSVTVTPPCREDVNGDGVINIVDIQSVAAHWNTVEGEDGYDPLYDINDDHRIDIIDVQLVSAKWNTTC
jgi:hypothetical protein